MSTESNFKSHFIISELNNNCDDFKSVLSAISQQQYLWKPAPDKWCLLELVCHLLDEEREDFKARLHHVLTNPELPLPPIDPVNWVTSRDYIKQDYSLILKLFLEERKKSLKWLNSLVDPDFKKAHHHPKFGAMSGELFLSNWLAHDYLHLRQIIKLKYDYLKFQTGQQDLKYAGEW